jgi:hypothetical protein
MPTPPRSGFNGGMKTLLAAPRVAKTRIRR